MRRPCAATIADVQGIGTIKDDDAAPRVSITKTFDIVGDEEDRVDSSAEGVTYTITVTNTGNQTLTNVIVTDPLP